MTVVRFVSEGGRVLLVVMLLPATSVLPPSPGPRNLGDVLQLHCYTASRVIETAFRHQLAQAHDAFRRDDQFLLLRRQIEGLYMNERRVSGCDGGQISGDVDGLVLRRRLLADMPLQRW